MIKIKETCWFWASTWQHSIGLLKSFWGNFIKYWSRGPSNATYIASDGLSLLPDLPACCHRLHIAKENKRPQQKQFKQTIKLMKEMKNGWIFYLAMLPGKPRWRVTSMCPTSIPSSRAFVAAIPQSFPLKKSLSILLLSCSTGQPQSKHNKPWVGNSYANCKQIFLTKMKYNGARQQLNPEKAICNPFIRVPTSGKVYI